MKKSIIAFLLFFLMLYARKADAIIFVPPAIYIVTLSLSAFVLNLFALFAVWFAAKGLIDRLYFGKTMHELVRLFFNLLGKFTILFVAAAVSILIYDPINKKEVLIVSLMAGLISLLLIFLDNFREHRFEFLSKKLYLIVSMLFFSLVVFVATYFSAMQSLEIKIIPISHDDRMSEFNISK